MCDIKIQEVPTNVFIKKFNDDLTFNRIQYRKTHTDISIGNIKNFLIEHVEIQNAIIELKTCDKGTNFTIYETTLYRDINHAKNSYIDFLDSLFETVIILQNSNSVYRYIVANCKPLAYTLYEEIKKRNKIDPYILLLEQHSSTNKFSEPFSVYKIQGTTHNSTEKSSFLDYNLKALSINSSIAINITGFTLNELINEPLILNLINFFNNEFILFSGECSIGLYIFS